MLESFARALSATSQLLETGESTPVASLKRLIAFVLRANDPDIARELKKLALCSFIRDCQTKTEALDQKVALIDELQHGRPSPDRLAAINHELCLLESSMSDVDQRIAVLRPLTEIP